MTTVAWFHCFSGVAGDMALGALLDAGAEVDDVRAQLQRLPVDGWHLDTEQVQRCGVRATRAVVRTEDQAHHRPVADVLRIVDAAALPDRAHRRARAVFELLASVEGVIHGVPPADVELHEVGALDAIVDVVGTCVALELLGVDEVHSSPVTTGLGTVRGAHGLLPNPSPAVVDLLARAGAPAQGVDVGLELATPTGVALLAALATSWGAMPAMTPSAVGRGAGTRDLPDRPNLLQVVVGEAAAPAFASPGQPLRLLEVNVDDTTGEVLAHAIGAVLAAGAHDAWVTPIVMKKGRPAHTVHALCDPALTSAVAAALTSETGSLGIRGSLLERWPMAREEHVVHVHGHPVRVKRGIGRAKVEHDDAVAAAAALGLPLRTVLDLASQGSEDAPRS